MIKTALEANPEYKNWRLDPSYIYPSTQMFYGKFSILNGKNEVLLNTTIVSEMKFKEEGGAYDYMAERTLSASQDAEGMYMRIEKVSQGIPVLTVAEYNEMIAKENKKKK